MAEKLKHRQVFAALRREIQSGKWKRGGRLPSEAELVERFGVSRITIGRAVRDLQIAGVVERRVGSGTFVKGAAPAGALSFGLLIPDLGDTEIFEPVCHGMMASPLARDHALLWGSAHAAGESKEEGAWQLCQQYIDRQVSGVFFAPLEGTRTKDEWNRRIASAFDDARVPVVLLDRTCSTYPDPGRYDLVGIDNRRAGCRITQHMIGLGSRRIAFVGPSDAASTVDEREAGYREALHAAHLSFHPSLVCRMNPDTPGVVSGFMQSATPDALVCANDRLAARLMPVVQALGYQIPRDLGVVGIDDVDYARLLPVPLTTLRQPTRQIGAVALSVMLDRVAHRDLPARHVYLQAELVVRQSCGAEDRARRAAREGGSERTR